MNNKPRRPWIAALLTLLTTGLGHLYAGNPKRGLILFCIGLFLTVLCGIILLVIPSLFFISLIVEIAFIIFCIIDALSIAKRKKENYELAKYNRWFVYVGYVVILSMVSALVNTGVTASFSEAYRIPSSAMAPTLLVGDHVLANKFIYGVKIPFFRKTIISVSEPKRDDVVIFIYPNDRTKNLIKRVIGVGGDTIEIINKKIFINGKEYSDSYSIHSDTVFYPAEVQPRDNFGPVTVPQNSLFVMGDNRDQSLDSRFWGFVDLKDVDGKAVMIYWSWNSETNSIRWERLNHLLK
ncbi:MAG: signal peptidase I [Smithellaceae bacterium]